MKNFLLSLKNNIQKVFQKKDVQIFLITLIIHLGALTFLSLVDLNLFATAGDHLLYDELGKNIAYLLKSGTYHLGDIYQYHWYPLFIGVIYYLFGASMFLGAIINVVLAGISAMIFYRILRAMNVSDKVSFWGTLFIMNGYASYVYHSSMLLKESWIVFLLLGVICSAIYLAQDNRKKWIFFGVGILLITALRSLRFFIGFSATVGFISYWFLNVATSRMKKIVLGLGMIGVTAGLGWTLYQIPVFGSATIVDMVNPQIMETTKMYSARDAASATNITVFKKITGSSAVTNKSSQMIIINKETVAAEPAEEVTRYAFSVKGFIQSVGTTLFGPFPQQIHFKKYVSLLPDTLFVYLLSVFAIVGVSITIKEKSHIIWKIIPLVIITGGILTAVAIGADNMGAIVRQRIPAFIVIAIIAMVGIDYVFKKYVSKT